MTKHGDTLKVQRQDIVHGLFVLHIGSDAIFGLHQILENKKKEEEEGKRQLAS